MTIVLTMQIGLGHQTKCHLRTSMTVRVEKVVPLLPSVTTSGVELSVAKVEGACQNSANCSKTQQKVLHPLSKDTFTVSKHVLS